MSCRRGSGSWPEAIPKVKSEVDVGSTFSFNFLSMFGFSSVLMTYFGVNYYLSGLHSYASGDPVPVPTFVYYTVGIMLLVSVSAAINDFKIKDQSPVLDEAAD